MVKRKHFVVFYSPGTLFSEESELPIVRWDPKLAVLASRHILERYNAKPYGFRFSTQLCSDPISDWEGGTLEVAPKEVATSAMYFITGSLVTLDDVEARKDEKDFTLILNMKANNYPIVVVNENSFRSTLPFREEDVVVDKEGNIQERGDSDVCVMYRAMVKERWAHES